MELFKCALLSLFLTSFSLSVYPAKRKMFMIPDSVLETLICQNCKNYLSVRPVKVYPSRRILCGRCSNEHDDGAISIYDSLAEFGLFKCINRYEGCDKVLRYSEVLEHEKTCRSSEHKCFCSTVTTSLPALLSHCKEIHKNSILQAPSFEICNVGRDFLNQYVYVTNNLIFYINVYLGYRTDNNTFISLSAIHVGSGLISSVYQKYILHTVQNGKKKNRYVTQRKLCSSSRTYLKNEILINYDIESNQTLYVEFDIDIRNAQKLIAMPENDGNKLTPGFGKVNKSKFFLTDQFYKLWSSKYRLSRNGSYFTNLNRKIDYCCLCQNIFLLQSETQSIYKCLCAECSNSNNLLCSKCFFLGVKLCINGSKQPYSFAAEETVMFKTVQYYCQMGCGEHFYSWCLKLHELNCPLAKE